MVGESFERCLNHLSEVFKICEDRNLVLNWGKCHFMVKEGIVLGHRISEKVIEVDRANVEVIERLPPPISVKGVRSFLGHAHPLCKLQEKDCKFCFDESCLKVFSELKDKLVSAPIIISPDWNSPFEVMCDASGVALRSIRTKKEQNPSPHLL